MRMRYGVAIELEEAANEIIRKSYEGVTSYEEKKEWLSPWKEKHRAKKEILTPTGFPEAHSRQGMYHRAANATRPDLNSRNGIAQSRNRGQSFAQTHLQEHGNLPDG